MPRVIDAVLSEVGCSGTRIECVTFGESLEDKFPTQLRISSKR
jgi:hypothetical protein